MKTTFIKTKHVTHAAKAVALGDDQVIAICKMLGWTEQQYYEHQYEQYEDFLKRVWYGQKDESYNKVRYSELMRGLWVNEWIVRNTVDFLPFAHDWTFEGVRELEDGTITVYLPNDDCPEALLNEYEFIHSAQRLSFDRVFLTRYYHVLKLIAKS